MRVNEVLNRLEGMQYPRNVGDIVTVLNDPTIELANGSQKLSDIYAAVDIDVVASPDEAKLVFLSGLDSAAIGREGYSDRDPPATSESGVSPLTL